AAVTRSSRTQLQGPCEDQPDQGPGYRLRLRPLTQRRLYQSSQYSPRYARAQRVLKGVDARLLRWLWTRVNALIARASTSKFTGRIKRRDGRDKPGQDESGWDLRRRDELAVQGRARLTHA